MLRKSRVCLYKTIVIDLPITGCNWCLSFNYWGDGGWNTVTLESLSRLKPWTFVKKTKKNCSESQYSLTVLTKCLKRKSAISVILRYCTAMLGVFFSKTMVQYLTSRCLTRTIITDNSCKPRHQCYQKSTWPNKVPEITKKVAILHYTRHILNIKCATNWNAYSRYFADASHVPGHSWKLLLGSGFPVMTVTASKRKFQLCKRTRKCSKANSRSWGCQT